MCMELYVMHMTSYRDRTRVVVATNVSFLKHPLNVHPYQFHPSEYHQTTCLVFNLLKTIFHYVGIRNSDSGFRPHAGRATSSIDTSPHRQTHQRLLIAIGYCYRCRRYWYPGVYVRRREADEKGRGPGVHLQCVHSSLASTL